MEGKHTTNIPKQIKVSVNFISNTKTHFHKINSTEIGGKFVNVIFIISMLF
jgi:hypothetical protein